MSDQFPGSPVKQVRWSEKTAIVDCEGDIDLSRSPMFQAELLKIIDSKPKRIVINLAEVRYMDSSGVASLVKLLSRVRKLGIQLRLAERTDRVRSVFEITRLDSVFEIHCSEAEALA